MDCRECARLQPRHALLIDGGLQSSSGSLAQFALVALGHATMFIAPFLKI